MSFEVPAFAVDVEITRGGNKIASRFTAPAGLTALIGPSGAGKTTVLDMIAGLLIPARGAISVAGAVLFDRAARIDLPPEARGCGYVFQNLRLFPHRNVADNLRYGWRLAPPERRWLAVEEAVDFLDIADLQDRLPATLSGGEAQRVAIGRALLAGPRFLLMDEPLTALDAARRAEIIAVILRIRDEFRLPILYVSHDRGEVARLADQVVELGRR